MQHIALDKTLHFAQTSKRFVNVEGNRLRIVGTRDGELVIALWNGTGWRESDTHALELAKSNVTL